MSYTNGFGRNKSFFDCFLLSRPYTIPTIIAIGLLAGVIGRGFLVIDSFLFADIVFALSLWFSMVYLNESFKTQYGRAKVTFIVPIVFFILASTIALVRNPLTFILIFGAFLSTFIYFLKARNWIGSAFVFVFRAGTEVAIFFSILLFYNGNINSEAFLIGAIIFFLTNSRNLIGDLRDIKFDKYTFPVRFGSTPTKAVSSIFLIATAILTSDFFTLLPIFVILILIAKNQDGYMLHNVFVICTAFYFVNLIAAKLTPGFLLVTNLAFLISLSSHTYSMVPRPSNPNTGKRI